MSWRVNDGKEEKEILVETVKSEDELNEQGSEYRERLMSAGRKVCSTQSKR